MANGKHTHASQQVLEYLRTRPNETASYTEITRAIHANTSHVVPNAIGHLMRAGLPIVRPMRGMAMYSTGRNLQAGDRLDTREALMASVPKPTTRGIYESVGKMEDRDIIRAEDDQLYVAIPIGAFFGRDQV